MAAGPSTAGRLLDAGSTATLATAAGGERGVGLFPHAAKGRSCPRQRLERKQVDPSSVASCLVRSGGQQEKGEGRGGGRGGGKQAPRIPRRHGGPSGGGLQLKQQRVRSRRKKKDASDCNSARARSGPPGSSATGATGSARETIVSHLAPTCRTGILPPDDDDRGLTVLFDSGPLEGAGGLVFAGPRRHRGKPVRCGDGSVCPDASSMVAKSPDSCQATDWGRGEWLATVVVCQWANEFVPCPNALGP